MVTYPGSVSYKRRGCEKKRKTFRFNLMLQPRANVEEAQLPTNGEADSNEVGEVPTNGGEDPTVVADGARMSRLNLAMWPTFPSIHHGPADVRFLHPRSFQAKYDLLGQIGSGRNGIVFVARAMHSDDVVAIKTSRKWSASAEPWLLRHCEHPNIVKVVGFFASPFITLIAMEKWDCIAFQYRRTFSVKTPQYWKIMHDVTNGLRHLHDLAVFHFDLHAMNIFMRHAPLEGRGGRGPSLLATNEDGGSDPTNKDGGDDPTKADGGSASSRDGGGDPIAVSMEACIGDLGNAFYESLKEAPDPHLIHPINYRALEVLFAKGAKLQMFTQPCGQRRIRYKESEKVPDQIFLGPLDMWAFGCFAHFFWNAKDVCTKSYPEWFASKLVVDDEAMCAASMLVSLGEPPKALVDQCDWQVVRQLRHMRAADENQISIWQQENSMAQRGAEFCLSCLSWDPRGRSTAASAHEQCKSMMAPEHVSA